MIRSGLTRLGKGEFGVRLDLPQDDEFGELGTFFNTVSQQLSADRSQLAGQKASLESAVEHLEDAVASSIRWASCCSAIPRCSRAARTRWGARRTLLPPDHPYAASSEETLVGAEVARARTAYASRLPGRDEGER